LVLTFSADAEAAYEGNNWARVTGAQYVAYAADMLRGQVDPRGGLLLDEVECGGELREVSGIGEEHLHHCLELAASRSGRLTEPAPELGPAGVGDAVDRARALACRLLDGRGEPVRDQALRLVVQLAFGPRPEPAEAAVHLLRELVRRPGPGSQQAEEGVRGGRTGRAHAAS